MQLLKSKKWFLCPLIIILIIFSSISLVRSLEISSFSFRRNNGYSSGKGQIQGDFTISATASDDTTSLKLLFNGTEVTSSNGKELSYRFNTDDWPNGWYNITIQAANSTDDVIQMTEMREFVPSSVNTPYWVLLGVIGGLSIIGAIFAAIIKKKRQNAPSPTKSDIKITIDKF